MRFVRLESKYFHLFGVRNYMYVCMFYLQYSNCISHWCINSCRCIFTIKVSGKLILFSDMYLWLLEKWVALKYLAFYVGLDKGEPLASNTKVKPVSYKRYIYIILSLRCYKNFFSTKSFCQRLLPSINITYFNIESQSWTVY